MIISKDNAKIKKVAALVNSSKKRKENGLFILEGTRLCSEALRENLLIKELFYTKDIIEKHYDLLEKLKTKAEFYDEVSNAVFEKISDTCSPQGVLLTFCFKDELVLKSLNKLIAFERISDPSNLGAAARTAEALGFSGIILSKYGTDPFSPKSLRASMGALLRLPIIYSENIIDTLNELKKQGCRIFGTVVDKNAEKINKVSFKEKDIIVIGNEAQGLSDQMKEVCDKLITIPMEGKAESLNAATAAAIAMWEMSR